MNAENESNIVVIEFSDLVSNIIDKLQDETLKHEDKNLILNLEELSAVDDELTNSLIKYSKEHKSKNLSFVIVSNVVNLDNEIIDIVPTLQEAYDYIEMEEIERDLGIDF